MKDINFQWDDKSIEEMLVRAFADRSVLQIYKTPKTIIEEFKSSHSTEINAEGDKDERIEAVVAKIFYSYPSDESEEDNIKMGIEEVKELIASFTPAALETIKNDKK